MSKQQAHPPLTDDQFRDLLYLESDSDSVELKLTVPEDSYSATARALGMDPLEACIRQVFFFDTPERTLNHARLVVRARRIQGANDDSTVKMHPVDPRACPKAVRQSMHFGVEVNAMPGGYVCSGSMKAEIGKRAVHVVVFDGKPICKLFNKEQRAFYEDHAPDGLALDDLAVLGPINVLKLKFLPKGSKLPLVAEVWLFPNNTSVLELSTKCAPKQALAVAGELHSFLAKKSVPLDGEQQTNTNTALELLSAKTLARYPSDARSRRPGPNPHGHSAVGKRLSPDHCQLIRPKRRHMPAALSCPKAATMTIGSCAVCTT